LTAEAAAFEAAGAGIDWTFSPMVDVARDQRWGRGVEGGGEDVLLGRLFAAARVQGFQGSDLKSTERMLACIKHFAAYGAAESGLDYNTVDMSEARLREVYLQPYKAGFDAGALSAMASFNEINGVPSTGNRWLMTDLLRGEWGFQGFVVSDYTGDEEMIAHGFAKDGRDAARLAFLAGVDMSMQSGLYRQHLPDLVRTGAVPQAQLDESVRRVLSLKAMLGLFENPYVEAGLATVRTLLDEPYLSTDADHDGLLLHSVYHRPNGWDYVPPGRSVPCGESSMWGDYHIREVALYVERLAENAPYYTFYGPVADER